MKWDTFQSYDQILAEAGRLTELPNWVHYASLAETAITRFPESCPTITAFWEDTHPAFTLPTACNYVAALKVWKETPRAVRNKVQHVTTYLSVHRDPSWNPRTSDTGKMVLQANRGNLYVLRAGFSSTISCLKLIKQNPQALSLISDDRLAEVYLAGKDLLEYLTAEGRKRVIKQQKGAA